LHCSCDSEIGPLRYGENLINLWWYKSKQIPCL